MGNELIFDGKKYISAIRASKIIGYNPDYIGQLCRKGLLDCRRVGRAWFVSEESLQSHRVTASLTPRGRISIYQKNLDAQNASSSVSAGAATLSNPMANPLGFSINPELSYKSFHQAAINFLDRAEQKRQSSDFARKVVGGVALVVLLLVFVVPNVVGTSRISEFFSGTNSDAGVSVVGSQLSGSMSYVQKYKTELISSVAYSSHIFSSIGTILDEELSDLINGAYNRLTRLNSFLAITGEKFGHSLFWSKHTDEDKPGFVVVPSGGSETNDRVKDYVNNNFSDETEVVPDETGNSGLIKPVFKNKTDQEYLYVMVPVKEGEKP